MLDEKFILRFLQDLLNVLRAQREQRWNDSVSWKVYVGGG